MGSRIEELGEELTSQWWMWSVRIAEEVDDVGVRGGMRLRMAGSDSGRSLGIGEDRKRSGWGFG
ncbi:hypothetical protein DVH24_013086 [Malus domestica]|uniref:Uncharacterized protein n=1 Tax=Malus domestica TaxID=3750 RepID=A0A498HTV2_MALDO|nr:hypothetical protein DVH24_013086 [Malus domestica]